MPFAAFTPQIVDPDGAPQTFHSFERRASVLGHDPVVSLTFEGPHAEGAENARVEVHVTDGARPERLGVGDSSVGVPGSPSLVTFANITPIFRTLPPCFERDRMWGWLQLLKTPLQELTAREPLAACLALANGPAWAAPPDSKPNADSFEPLADVRLLQGGADQDVATSIAIDVRPEAFVGRGPEYLGQVVQGLWLPRFAPTRASASSSATTTACRSSSTRRSPGRARGSESSRPRRNLSNSARAQSRSSPSPSTWSGASPAVARASGELGPALQERIGSDTRARLPREDVASLELEERGGRPPRRSRRPSLASSAPRRRSPTLRRRISCASDRRQREPPRLLRYLPPPPRVAPLPGSPARGTPVGGAPRRAG